MLLWWNGKMDYKKKLKLVLSLEGQSTKGPSVGSATTISQGAELGSYDGNVSDKKKNKNKNKKIK
jgi:hypothetical protein